MSTIQLQGTAPFAEALEYFKEVEPRFTVERTGYTAAVKLPTGEKYLFAETPVKLSLFGIFSRLKAQVRRAGVPEVEEGSVNYFDLSRVKRETLPSQAVSVDLTSAYTYALKNLSLIDEKLFSDLCKLPKQDRLKVVGMLATTKTVLHYADGKVTSATTTKSETRGAFFATCKVVGELMQAVSAHPRYLMFWVDGAFFDGEPEGVKEYFEREGYPAKLERITDIRLSDSGKVLFYTKDGTRKYLCIPKKTPSAKWIEDLLNKPQTPKTP